MHAGRPHTKICKRLIVESLNPQLVNRLHIRIVRVPKKEGSLIKDLCGRQTVEQCHTARCITDGKGDDITDDLGAATFITTLDLTRGCW